MTKNSAEPAAPCIHCGAPEDGHDEGCSIGPVQHAPGPWYVKSTVQDYTGYKIEQRFGKLIRTIARDIPDKRTADLIARAPEMATEIERLRAELQKIIDAWDDESVSLNQFGDGDFFDTARAALAQESGVQYPG